MVRKLSINYSDTAGQPRYVLEITKWDTDPIPASSFQLELPKDARQIDLLATIKAGSENVGAPPAASPDAK
jgi:hypothetical protein